MKRRVVFILVALALTSATPRAQEQERLFKAAMNTELVDGDLKKAIEQYGRVAAGGNRALAAQALVRMAECYQKLGDSQARTIYQRLVREFGDQPESVAIARARLGATAAQSSAGVTMKALPRTNGLLGTVSPDGRYLSFSPWADGELHVRDLQAGTDRVLTRRGDYSVGLSAISRDATRVAYQAYGGGCDAKSGGLPALCLVSLAEGGVPTSRAVFVSQDILEIAPMDWSPDGGTIAVSVHRQDRTAQIGLVSVADGSLRVLKTVDWRGPLRIAYSPDGRDLVFDLPVSETSDDRDITLVAVDGSRGLPLVEHPGLDIVMGWTPDGSALLFGSDRGGSMGLWLQPLSERRPVGAPRPIRGGLGGFLSAGVTKGGALYFTVNISDRDIWVTAIDLVAGKAVAAPTRRIQQFVGTNMMADWSADGRYLAYVSQRGGGRSNAGRVIGVRDMKTGDERALRPALTYFGPIDWAPDGASFVTAGTDLKGRSGVFRIDAKTAAVSLVAEDTDDAYPKWSPDGKHVFYRKGAQQQFTDFSIVERDLSSGAERTVASGELGVFSVSPDGRSIAAPVGGILGAAAPVVREIRVDNGAMRDLLRAGPSERFPPYIAPQWTPDGRAVIVRKRAPNELWFVPMAGEPRKLDVDVREWSFGAVGQMSIHPDGRQVAFLSGTLSSEVMVLENFLPR